MRASPTISLCLVPACLLLAGCNQQQPKPVLPGTRQVPLKVWVILGTLPSETIGNRGNAGCRLTTQEISTHISDLQSHANFFGNGTTFPWDGQLNIVNFTNLIIFNPNGNRRRDCIQFEEEVLGVQEQWTPSMVNVYFCGAFDGDTNSSNDLYQIPAPGFNADPAQLSTPYIVINDGGPWNRVGWSAHQGDWILEHEMTHFMGRFASRTFGGYVIGGQTVSLTYDSTEHTPDEPVGWKLVNILYGGGWPYSLRLGNVEKSEIIVRIQQGQWPNP